MTSTNHAASQRVLDQLRREFTFQISVDVDNIPQGLTVAGAALSAGITLVEMGTPLLKCAGVYNVVPAFRQAFPDALLLADMKRQLPRLEQQAEPVHDQTTASGFSH